MLKLTILLVLGVAWVAQGAKITGHTADMDFLHKQQKIYDLLFFIQQSSLTDTEYYEIGRNFDIESNIDFYADKEFVQKFLRYYKQGALSQSAVFSPYYDEHLTEVKYLFKLFYSAKDFQSFYKTACWARINMNNGVFTSALTIAVFNRQDCKYMRLPPIYEIYPNLFFDSNVIQEAHRIKMTRGFKSAGTSMDNIESYMIYANYSGGYARYYDDDEYKLDYFMEDYGLNSFYYYFRQVFPFWLNSKEYNMPHELRGSFYYYTHQQLIARYQLERISNDLGKVEDFAWTKPFYPGYYSTLMYQNGIPLPQRSRYSNVPYYKYKYLKEVDILENRIMNAIDSGFVYDTAGKQINIYSPEGLNILGNLIEGNVDSCNRRFYGMYDALARDILGFNLDFEDKNKVIPSALQCYSTSMRDPAFYRLYKRIMNYFFRYKANMPQYTKNELIFSGVKIENVNVDKLMTYFDYCDAFINNALSVESFREGMSLRVKTRRYCLNHKPYTYQINVNSDKETKATIKVFLGPVFSEYPEDLSYLSKYYKYFVQLDNFVVNLHSGNNNIERRSTDSTLTMPDMTPSDIFYKKLQKAITGSEPFTYYEKTFGFPERLVLPKGKPEGMMYKLFFYISSYEEGKGYELQLPVFGKEWFDGKPFGFPLDRPVYAYQFLTPNMFFKNVYIYHTKEEKGKPSF